MELLRKFVSQLCARFLAWLQATNPATLQLTGILGLALMVIGYFHFRGNDSEPSQRRQQLRSPDPAAAAAQRQLQQARAAAPSGEPGPSSSGQQQQQAAQPKVPSRPVAGRDTPIARAVASRLQGIRRITVSCPGVLLQQWQPGQLTEQATLWPLVAELVREMTYISDVYLIGHVTDDIGQALVSGALEAAGVVGSQQGQVPSQRLLFCSTPEGKVAMARQLESELHIDSAHTTIDTLQRLLPQLLHVCQPAGPDAGPGANIARANSLAEFFGL